LLTLLPVLIVLTMMLAACGADDDDDAATAPTAMSATGSSAATATPAASASTPTEPPATATATSQPAATSTPVPAATDTPAPAPTATAETQPTATLAPVTEPVAVLSGAFYEIDYSGGGTAVIFQNPDGSYVLRFIDFSTEDGPNLVVYLSAARDVDNAAVLSNDFISLGPLQSTAGEQSYVIPADVDPFAWGSVVIWCADFDVGFIAANLAPA
jgi:hypothetical protein